MHEDMVCGGVQMSVLVILVQVHLDRRKAKVSVYLIRCSARPEAGGLGNITDFALSRSQDYGAPHPGLLPRPESRRIVKDIPLWRGARPADADRTLDCRPRCGWYVDIVVGPSVVDDDATDMGAGVAGRDGQRG